MPPKKRALKEPKQPAKKRVKPYNVPISPWNHPKGFSYYSSTRSELAHPKDSAEHVESLGFGPEMAAVRAGVQERMDAERALVCADAEAIKKQVDEACERHLEKREKQLLHEAINVLETAALFTADAQVHPEAFPPMQQLRDEMTAAVRATATARGVHLMMDDTPLTSYSEHFFDVHAATFSDRGNQKTRVGVFVAPDPLCAPGGALAQRPIQYCVYGMTTPKIEVRRIVHDLPRVDEHLERCGLMDGWACSGKKISIYTVDGFLRTHTDPSK